jgi:sRNA-binding regulator protein Hfq
MELLEGYSDLRNDYLWNIRFNQSIVGNQTFDIPREFTSGIIAVLATTTNINQKNRAGYLTQTVNLFQVGGITEVSTYHVLLNNTRKVIVFPHGISPFTLRFKLAFPVGNCNLKIWEAIPKLE